MKRLKYLAVLDFEATCDQDPTQDPTQNSVKSTWRPELQEIIELPLQLIDLEHRVTGPLFHRLVRPTAQPEITPFCTELTTLTQSDFEDALEISDVLEQLRAWLDEHEVTAENTCVVTCGDWDLRRMWPQQLSVCPQLNHLELFTRWCNIKHVFLEHTGVRAQGMMSLLDHAQLPHRGVHHRGIDDVENLTRFVLWALNEGWRVSPTWGPHERDQERLLYQRRIKKKCALLDQIDCDLERLPAHVSDEVRLKQERSRDHVRVEIARLALKLSAFRE